MKVFFCSVPFFHAPNNRLKLFLILFENLKKNYSSYLKGISDEVIYISQFFFRNLASSQL